MFGGGSYFFSLSPASIRPPPEVNQSRGRVSIYTTLYFTLQRQQHSCVMQRWQLDSQRFGAAAELAAMELCPHTDSGFFLTPISPNSSPIGNQCFISREFSEHRLLSQFNCETVESVWKIGNFANDRNRCIESCVIPGPRNSKWQVLVGKENEEQNDQMVEVVSIFAKLIATSEMTSATVCFQLETGMKTWSICKVLLRILSMNGEFMIFTTF